MGKSKRIKRQNKITKSIKSVEKPSKKPLSLPTEITLIFVITFIITAFILANKKTSKETENFLALANFIVQTTTEKPTLSEKLKALTKRLYENPSIVHQLNSHLGVHYGKTYTLIQSAFFLGVKEFRLIKRTALDTKLKSKEAGYYFAELKVGDKWEFYDPTVFHFREKSGSVLSLTELAGLPELHDSHFLQQVFSKPLDNEDYFYYWTVNQIEAPKPLGKLGFTLYKIAGEQVVRIVILIHHHLTTIVIWCALLLCGLLLLRIPVFHLKTAYQQIPVFLICLAGSAILFSFLIPKDEETRQFLFNAHVVGKIVENQETQRDKVKAITDWLHENIHHGQYYPAVKLRNATESIKAGYGNCGIQGRNVVELASFLGLEKHRLIRSPDPEHVVAEIKIDGKWELYDADSWKYIEQDGKVLSLKEIAKVYDQIDTLKENEYFKKPLKNRLQYTSIKVSQLYPGIPVEMFFTVYQWLGKRITATLLVFLKQPLAIFFFALLLFSLFLRIKFGEKRIKPFA